MQDKTMRSLPKCLEEFAEVSAALAVLRGQRMGQLKLLKETCSESPYPEFQALCDRYDQAVRWYEELEKSIENLLEDETEPVTKESSVISSVKEAKSKAKFSLESGPDFTWVFKEHKIDAISLDPLTKILHPEWGSLSEERYRSLKVALLSMVTQAVAAGILEKRGKMFCLAGYTPKD